MKHYSSVAPFLRKYLGKGAPTVVTPGKVTERKVIVWLSVVAPDLVIFADHPSGQMWVGTIAHTLRRRGLI